jgi:hypothetical protein
VLGGDSFVIRLELRPAPDKYSNTIRQQATTSGAVCEKYFADTNQQQQHEGLSVGA